MTLITCRLTAKNRDKLRNHLLSSMGYIYLFTSYPCFNKIVRRLYILPFVRYSKPLVEMQVFPAVLVNLVFGYFGVDDAINISSRYLAAQSKSTGYLFTR